MVTHVDYIFENGSILDDDTGDRESSNVIGDELEAMASFVWGRNTDTRESRVRQSRDTARSVVCSSAFVRASDSIPDAEDD